MFMHHLVTEEQKKNAKVNGYTAGWSEDITEPPQLFGSSTILLFCWFWGYSQGKRDKTEHFV